MRVCNCSMFCCTFLYVHSSFAIILMGKRKLLALLSLSSCCFLMCVALHRDAMGLSAICDCGISWSYSLTILGSEYPLYLLYINHKTGDLVT